MDFCPLLKAWVKKSLSNKYGQKRLDSAKKSTTNAIKTASKRPLKKNSRSNW